MNHQWYSISTNIPSLVAFDNSDKARRHREEVLDSLEAFTYKSRDYLEDESFVTASTAEARSTLEKLLSSVSDWLSSESSDATLEVLKAKLKELEDIVKPVLKRKSEAAGRPEAIKSFEINLKDLKTSIDLVKKQIDEQNVALSKSSEEASKASAASTETPSPSSDPLDELDDDKASSSSSAAAPEPTEVAIIYTEEDLTMVQEAADKASKWFQEKKAAQDKLKEYEDPALTVKELKAEADNLSKVLTNVMMKKMAYYNYPKTNKSKAKSSGGNTKKSKKASPKKNTPPSSKPQDGQGSGPTQEELDAALEKAGLKKEGIKLQAGANPKEMRDKDGRVLTQLELGEDATEEEIMEAIRKATEKGREDKKGAEEKGKKEGVRDEL